MADTSLVVLGVDPGSQRTGWGIIAEQSGVLRLVDCGIIRTTSGGEKEFSRRLAVIYRQLADVVGRYRPQEATIEQVFTARNAASALKLGQARGVAVAACAAHGVPVSDYEPTLVKKSVVGTGRAEKEQVAFMDNNGHLILVSENGDAVNLGPDPTGRKWMELGLNDR